jgi:hypothetical protein
VSRFDEIDAIGRCRLSITWRYLEDVPWVGVVDSSFSSEQEIRYRWYAACQVVCVPLGRQGDASVTPRRNGPVKVVRGKVSCTMAWRVAQWRAPRRVE